MFSYTIRYLKSQVLNDICLRGHDVEADDIKWVLTVPACWTDLAKQFMRKAAEMVSSWSRTNCRPDKNELLMRKYAGAY